MNEYLSFFQNHTFLVAGFFGLLGFIAWTEYNRFTAKFKQLNTNLAVQLLNNDQTIVLDVRETKETHDGMINNAKHMPMSEFKKRLTELQKNKTNPILVYCRSGSRSAQACRMLVKEGFENVSNLSGGMMSWMAANLPIKS